MKSIKNAPGSLRPPSYPLVNTLNKFERNEALKQLASKISEVCSLSGRSDELIAFQLEELPNIFQLLAELAIEAKGSDTNREEKNKILHVAAAMLRRILHMPEASHYRVLGLGSEANSAQIAEHYRLLHELFWFDGTIDPQQKSRLRIFEAYTILKDPESRHRYDEELTGFERREPRTGRSDLWRVVAVVLPVILGLSAVMFYIEKKPETEIAYSLSKEQSDVHVATAPVAALSSEGQAEQQFPLPGSFPTQPSKLADDVNSSSVFLPEEVPDVADVVHAVNSTQDNHRAQVDDMLSFSQEPSASMASPEVPQTATSEIVRTKLKESAHKEVGKYRPADVSDSVSRLITADPKPVRTESIAEAQIDAELLLPNLLPKPSLLSITSTEVPQPENPAKVPARFEEPTQQKVAPQRPPALSDNSASKLAENSELTMVIIGSPNLEMSRLTKKQVEKLFLGKMAMLPRWQGVEILDQQDGNKIKRNFYNAITKKTLMQIKADWIKLQFGGLTSQGLIRPPEVLDNDQAIKNRVATSKSAIGYINRASLDSTVKVLLSLK